MGVDNRNIPEQLINPGREARPRSLLDLIDLKTFDLDLAAWLVSHVSKGASLITGSGPGGIGKSTTMRSLLAFAPGHLPFFVAWPGEIRGIHQIPCCIISHEVSDHPPPGYIWGQDVRDYFAHSKNVNMLASNMHADDLSEVYQQIVEENNVPESQFRSINLFMFVWLEGRDMSDRRRIHDTTSRRYVTKIFYSDGKGAHDLVYSDGKGLSDRAPRDAAYEKKCRAFLEDAVENSTRDINGLRHRFLDWAQQNA